MIGRRPIHLMKEEDRKVLPKFEDLWIDIGAKDKADALKLVELGDPAVLDYGIDELRDGILVGRGIDDRIGAFVALEALRLLKGKTTSIGVYAVATTQEEIGSRGAQTSCFGIDPQVGIAVDVGFCTDHPGMDDAKKKWGEVTMRGGPILTRGPNANPQLFKRFARHGRARTRSQSRSSRGRAAPERTGTRSSWCEEASPPRSSRCRIDTCTPRANSCTSTTSRTRHG